MLERDAVLVELPAYPLEEVQRRLTGRVGADKSDDGVLGSLAVLFGEVGAADVADVVPDLGGELPMHDVGLVPGPVLFDEQDDLARQLVGREAINRGGLGHHPPTSPTYDGGGSASAAER